MPEPDQRILAAVVGALGGSPRPGQQRMVREVGAVMDAGGTLLVQAGTGTGKSLGYLVPAAGRADANNRVVISTATIALQRQLMRKDVPLVSAAARATNGREITAAALKGWQNYVCRNKVDGGYPDEEPTLFDLATQTDAGAPSSELGSQVMKLRSWAQQTDTGDRDDLEFTASDRAWRQVSVTKNECLGSHCRFFEECFARLAREQAAEADLIVTNHSMLGLMATGNEGLIPPHGVVVIDEAHELVDRVTSAASQQISVRSLMTASKRARQAGAASIGSFDSTVDAFAQAIVAVPEGRIRDEFPASLAAAVEAVRDGARQVLSDLRGDDQGNASTRLARASLTEVFEVAERVAAASGADVLWVSPAGPDSVPALNVAPLDVSSAIAGRVLRPRSAILTSATLFLGGKFEPFARGIGLWDPQQKAPWPRASSRLDDEGRPLEPAALRWRGERVETPFSYSRQGILYVARELPPPAAGPVPAGHIDAIVELMLAAGGRTLGLFTSRRAAVEAAQAVRARVPWPVLSQDEGHLGELVRTFAGDEETSLFGTRSLWQGIDVPGDSCRLVIIDKIPFARPDDPIASARIEQVTRAGGNGFQVVSLASAALALAQGVGRLIRSDSDRGVVAILDPRVASKSYGSFLVRSLPDFWRTDDRRVAVSALGRLQAAARTD
ncbi:ATP-dependent DNA helicase DinG [Rarobacter incanus]|uniref:DNA 5'-3' helicase n=1 Tax=Rarobacter incanus TaxID=153494 RepID=A0A542SLX1_9MICO|nr:ATP-dependent DNA helicase DinG [Rarobacter incanus]